MDNDPSSTPVSPVPTALLAASAILFVTMPLPAQAPSAELAPCEVEAYDGRALCGDVEVPEDPEASDGRRIGLRVLVLPATAPDSLRRPDPVFILDGGPGQAATRSAEWVTDELSEVLELRDIVMVDRRGTGGSNPLECPSPTDRTPEQIMRPRPDGWIDGCREALDGRADLTRYTTPYAADDLDVVRRALGYERINLYGGSYGSREAFEYLRRHPRHLRAAAVFAVTPQHRRALLQAPASAERSLQRLIDDCMSDDRCRAAYPDLRRELREVTERLSESPASFHVTAPDGSRTGPLELTRTRWGSLIRSLLISPGGAAQVPHLIHLTHQRRYDEVGGLYVGLAGSTSSNVARGLFLSAVCAEEMARASSSEIDAAARHTFWGSGWVRGIESQCADWPVGNLPDGWLDPPRGDAPFLFLSGWLDPIAPPAWARQLTRWMPNARRVLVREGHHNFRLDDCGKAVLARFYETADPFNLDAACIAASPRPDFLVP